MPYTAGEPGRTVPEEVRARIPGWGVDLDPKNPPAFPRERFDPDATGAHWDFPERQEEKWPRERSIEHKFLTPVFGTATPLHGLSGAIRRLAYRRYSEGRAAHWLLLIAGDRVDAVESHLRSLASARPDDPITESGVLSERRHRPIRSRFGRGRADVSHMWMDPVIIVGPWLLAGWLAFSLVKRVVGRRPA
ncbi:hypothetical protein [Salinibacterium sp. ZJ450]|uniref:hypothetical protein n=1 Tax=Salinibacterium sp. ZJ450 TaxID=2708338 RepID=UPI0014206144|nr:hypothetical protein [Salinibacterium sp. ZJ450]